MATLTDFVTAEDSVVVRWEGRLRDRVDAEDVVLGTTDGSLVYCSETGRLGALPRDHVAAVESEVRTEVEYDLEDYRLIVGGGAALAAASFLLAVLAPSGWVALVLLVGTAAGLWAVEHGWRNREDYDGFGRRETEVERVVVTVDDGSRREFRFPTGDRAGAQLSRFVQGN